MGAPFSSGPSFFKVEIAQKKGPVHILRDFFIEQVRSLLRSGEQQGPIPVTRLDALCGGLYRGNGVQYLCRFRQITRSGVLEGRIKVEA